MKTLNQIAKENKVSKQQVYRIYKTEIEPLGKVHRLNNIIHLDEAGENIVKSRLSDKSASESHHEAHQVSEVLHGNEAVESTEKTDFFKNTTSELHQKTEFEALHEALQGDEAHQNDEAVEDAENTEFLKKTTSEPHHDDEMKHFNEVLQKQMIDILHEQLKVKDQQISELNQRLAEAQELQRANQVLLHQQQDNKQSKLVEDAENVEEPQPKKGFWNIFFK